MDSFGLAVVEVEDATDVTVFRVIPVNVDRGRVDVRATLPPELVREAAKERDGGPVTLAIGTGLLRVVASTAPRPVADVVRDALDGITAGMEAIAEAEE